MNEQEKVFNISFVVSCKNIKCQKNSIECFDCLNVFVGQHIIKYLNFRFSEIITSNNSKQFGISFNLICKKPDCTKTLPRNIVCCTANSEKCELCLRTIVNRGIIEMSGFHAKELTVA